MASFIVPIILELVKFIFGRIADSSENKKKIAKMIGEWMVVMRKEFLSSAEMSEAFKELWKRAETEPLTETK